MMKTQNVYKWAIIGAGPAGLTAAGLLLDEGVSSKDIMLIDPAFEVGDFGAYWGEVYSNTTVQNFLEYLYGVKNFNLNKCKLPLLLTGMDLEGYCQLKIVTQALEWITSQLMQQVVAFKGTIQSCGVKSGLWHLLSEGVVIKAHNVILATGGSAKKLVFPQTEEIPLQIALTPNLLAQSVKQNDCVAVFGSSHSSMIIMKNLLDQGVKNIVNFYLSPHRYAINMGEWTLYDNTGLKGLTAQWVKENISRKLDKRIERCLSNEKNLNQYMSKCNKAVYSIGFEVRSPQIKDIDVKQYDKHTGIIAPGLFGCGIAFPQVNKNPLGIEELNVGLNKFMRDIKKMLPIWRRYGL